MMEEEGLTEKPKDEKAGGAVGGGTTGMIYDYMIIWLYDYMIIICCVIIIWLYCVILYCLYIHCINFK